MIKKSLLGAALGAGALYAVFGTSAWSTVWTAIHNVREGAKSVVGIQFQIDRARGDLASLEPERHKRIENLARDEEDVKTLDREIVAIRTNLSVEKTTMIALRERLNTGDLKLTGNVTYTEDEVKADLKERLDHYTLTEELLKEKEETLKAKQKAVIADARKLSQIETTRKALETKLNSLETRFKMIQATRESNEVVEDDGALARIKDSITDLEKQVNIKARASELEGRYSSSKIPVIVEPSRDVLKEMQAKFGPPAVKTSTSDKNL
jgi:hypothetical protein